MTRPLTNAATLFAAAFLAIGAINAIVAIPPAHALTAQQPELA